MSHYINSHLVYITLQVDVEKLHIAYCQIISIYLVYITIHYQKQSGNLSHNIIFQLSIILFLFYFTFTHCNMTLIEVQTLTNLERKKDINTLPKTKVILYKFTMHIYPHKLGTKSIKLWKKSKYWTNSYCIFSHNIHSYVSSTYYITFPKEKWKLDRFTLPSVTWYKSTIIKYIILCDNFKGIMC